MQIVYFFQNSPTESSMSAFLFHEIAHTLGHTSKFEGIINYSFLATNPGADDESVTEQSDATSDESVDFCSVAACGDESFISAVQPSPPSQRRSFNFSV